MRDHLFHIAAASVLLAAVFVPTTIAQTEEPIVLDEMLVTGSRLPVALDQTPGNTTLLNREEIEALAPSSTEELLRLLPGLHLTGGGGNGKQGFVHMRGGDPNFTAVYIDGVRVNDPTDSRGGSFDFNTLDPAEIEKIEIVRGPMSSVHGSTALAGAISITTRGSEERELWANVEGGSDELLRASFGSGRSGENWERQVRLSHSAEGEVVPGNDFLSQSVDVNVVERGSALSFRYNRSERESFPESSGGPSFAERREVEKEKGDQMQLHFSSEYPFGRGSLGIALSGLQKDTELESPGVENLQPASESDGRYRRGEVELIYRVKDPADELVLGAALSSEDGETAGLLFDAAGPGVDLATDFSLYRRVGSVFAEGLHHHRLVTAQASLRLDAADGERGEWSPRVGARHRLSRGGGSLKANWGESFKLASLYALGDPLVGDSGLENETSRGWDVAFVQPLMQGRLELEAGYYDSRYENLIDFDAMTFSLVNRSEVDISGIELSMRAQPVEALSLSGQLSQSKSEVRGSGDALLERPEWTASVHGQWRLASGHSIGAKILYVGEVPAFSGATGPVDLEAYTRVDLVARYRLAHRWTAVFALDNVFDETYEEAVGFPSHGFRPRVGISYR